MKKNDKQSKRIYLKAEREWIEVNETLYREYIKENDAYRKKEQYHGRCVCPKSKFWLCDTDCLTCEFHRRGDQLSLDHTLENEDGDTYTLLEQIADPTASAEEMLCEMEKMHLLLQRLFEIMPDALLIAQLRDKGLTDEAISKKMGIPRTTLLSRLKKARQQVISEFSETSR